MLKCRDVTELTTEYMEGALPPARWLAVRFHFAICGWKIVWWRGWPGNPLRDNRHG